MQSVVRSDVLDAQLRKVESFLERQLQEYQALLSLPFLVDGGSA